MNYFAYGSNMLPIRLKNRVSGAVLIGSPYILREHDLRFHKLGLDNSAKCDAIYTYSGSDIVEGVLFDINSVDIPILDDIEGKGYSKKTVSVTDRHGKSVQAFIYYATNIIDTILPYTWYKKHVLEGAKMANLSEDYILKISSIKATTDPNYERELMELSIYGK